MRPNYEIILRALQSGLEWTAPDNLTYTLSENKLLISATKYSNGKEHEVWLYSGISLNTFLELCRDTAQDDVIALAADTSLNII